VKVLLLATDAYGGHGGIALFNRDLAAALAVQNDVTVVPRIVPHNPQGVPSTLTFYPEAARGEMWYARILARARLRRPDLVICGHVNLLPFACLIARRPLLMTFGIEAWNPLRDPISNRLLHRCRGIASISAVTRDRLVAWSAYRGPTYLLPNAVDVSHFGIRPKRRDLVDRYRLAGKRVLLTVGRLAGEERRKGFDEVLSVLPDLPSDVCYVIAGGGPDGPRLRQYAADLGVTDRVVFTGLFPEEEKADLYNLADLYVMPSRGEGFGFVFLEAMACGLPVIGSKLDGGREALLDGKLGPLVDPANPAEIRAAILGLLACSERRIPSELQYFSFESFTARVADVIGRATV
jgi:phosphatidyl-myo-inositol dimannoside synthase